MPCMALSARPFLSWYWSGRVPSVQCPCKREVVKSDLREVVKSDMHDCYDVLLDHAKGLGASQDCALPVRHQSGNWHMAPSLTKTCTDALCYLRLLFVFLFGCTQGRR